MHLLGETVLGAGILLLLAAMVAVKQISTGAILDKPQGNFFMQLVNMFNLFFLLIVNPLAAVGLLTGVLASIDATRMSLAAGWPVALVELAGLLLYLAGFILMGWALLTLGRYYQLGGSPPRPQDNIVMQGPYRVVRHPMYAAALGISLGLSLLIQSLAFFAVFVIYVALLTGLIPMEERELEKAYGADYLDYQRRTRMLVPGLF